MPAPSSPRSGWRRELHEGRAASSPCDRLCAIGRAGAGGIARSGAYNRTLTPFGFQSEERSYWDSPETYYNMFGNRTSCNMFPNLFVDRAKWRLESFRNNFSENMFPSRL